MHLLKRIVCLSMFVSLSLPILALTKQELDQKYPRTAFHSQFGSFSGEVQTFLQ
ncbi:MAG: hypothetical protein HYW48_05065 [Deltaproteobacteria bacterium]|nr:hypothetical protein [Deltaproteobacteria bacterium]